MVRSLAGSMAGIREEDLPLHFTSDLLDSLDAGGNGKVTVLSKYELQWWTSRKPRTLDVVKILDPSTIDKCLDHFRSFFPNTNSPIAGTDAGPSNAVPSHAGSSSDFHCAGPSGTSPTNAGPSTADPLKAGPCCINCGKYRKVLSDVLLDIMKFKNFASVMSTSTENLASIRMRKASIFYTLHESAVLKETTGIPTALPNTTPRRISAVMTTARSELERLQRLQELPASSHKWTWGETLTEDEVLALSHTSTKPGRGQHSGYNVSLREGKLDGEGSGIPSHLPTEVPAPTGPVPGCSVPPPTDLTHPSFFCRPDHNIIYDPFRLPTLNQVYVDTSLGSATTPPIAGPRFSPNAGTGTAHSPAPAMALAQASALASVLVSGPAFDIIQMAENWSMDSSPGSPRQSDDVLQMADAWSPVSDSTSIEVETKGPEEANEVLPLGIAEMWESDAEVQDMSHTSPFQVADAWIDSDNEDTLNREIRPAATTEEFRYGPEHFAFLQDEMFVDSSEEE